MLTKQTEYKHGITELGKLFLISFMGLFFTFSIYANPIFTEKISYQVEILEDGQIQVRKATRILKDRVEVGKQYHRHVIEPGADLSKESKKVKAIAKAVWTDEVMVKWAKELEKRKKRELPVKKLSGTIPPLSNFNKDMEALK